MYFVSLSTKENQRSEAPAFAGFWQSDSAKTCILAGQVKYFHVIELDRAKGVMGDKRAQRAGCGSAIKGCGRPGAAVSSSARGFVPQHREAGQWGFPSPPGGKTGAPPGSHASPPFVKRLPPLCFTGGVQSSPRGLKGEGCAGLESPKKT